MPSSRRDARRAARPLIGLGLLAAAAGLALCSPALGATAAAGLPDAVTQTAAPGTGGVDGESSASTAKPIATATLTQCATATMPQTERSATFAGEMTAIAGTMRMQMRIELEERIPGEPQYWTVDDPALGVWHASAPGVKVFTHIQQVSNLSAPADYRGVVRFRWVNAKGRTIKYEQLSTSHCEQPAPPPSTPSSPSTTTTGTVAGAPGAAS